jgi:predicted RNase H-like HicB family nuclease
VISTHIAQGLRRAQDRIFDDGLFCATVAGLPGAIATGRTLEACRDQLVEVVEEWLLVRVSQGLRIPRLSTGRRAEPTCRPAPSPSVHRTSPGSG